MTNLDWEFPGEYIIVYVSSSTVMESPMRVFESCSIESILFNVDDIESARPLSDVDAAAADNSLSLLPFRIIHLRYINVRTITGKQIKINVREEKGISPTKKQKSTIPDDLDEEEALLYNARERFIDLVSGELHEEAELRLLVRKQVKIESRTMENELEISVVAPDVIDLVKLEAVVYNPDFKFNQELEDMIKSTFDGLKNKKAPKRIEEGVSGIYFMQDSSGEKIVSVFKPIDEELHGPNNPFDVNTTEFRTGIETEERAVREVAAYLLDHPRKGHRSECPDAMGSAGVPPTVMVKCLHYGFNSRGAMVWKTGSLQKFMENTRSSKELDDLGFDVDDIQRISVLDIRLANLDRHGDNLLTWRDDTVFVRNRLIPIDHGFCFPPSAEDCIFEWTKWPKANTEYSSEIEEYVKKLDADRDIEYLKSYGWDMGPEAERTFKICTMLLKKGVDKNVSAIDIGATLMNPDLLESWKVFQWKHYSLWDMVREAETIAGPDASQAEFFGHLDSILDTQLDAMKLMFYKEDWKITEN